MRRALCSLVLFALFLVAGCGSGAGKVKGRILENGQPKTFPATTYAVEVTLLGANGQPDTMKSFTAVVDADGSFEVVASGGQVPPGTYQFTIRGMASKIGEPKVTSKREIVAGDNDITLDLAKPGE